MSMARASAVRALGMAALATGFAVLQVSWGVGPWVPFATAALLAGPALLTLQGSTFGLRALIAAWALILGFFIGHFSAPAPPPNPNSYSVDPLTGLLVLAFPAIASVGLIVAVLHKERK